MTPGLNPIQELTVWILPLLIAFTMHEAGHAYAAYLVGDRTGYQAGRVTLNPLRHLDPFGSVLLPAVGILSGGAIFGWAKPTPVRIPASKHWRRDSVLVTLAGPSANLVLMMISLGLLYIVPYLPTAGQEWVSHNLVNSAGLNAILFVLNLLPVPGFDGGWVLAALLPQRLGRFFSEYAYAGTIIFLVLFLVIPMLARAGHSGLDPFRLLVGIPANHLEYGVASMFGLT